MRGRRGGEAETVEMVEMMMRVVVMGVVVMGMTGGTDNNNNVFMVVHGFGRSGSTLLANFLFSTVPSPGFFWDEILPHFDQYKEMCADKADAVSKVLNCDKEMIEIMCNISRHRQVISGLYKPEDGFRNQHECVHTAVPRCLRSTVRGAKLIKLAPQDFLSLLERFDSNNQTLKAVHLIRHPIPLYKSREKVGWILPNIEELCEIYLENFQIGLKFPNNYFPVRYQDVVSRPEQTIAQLQKWAGIQPNTEAIQQFVSQHFSQNPRRIGALSTYRSPRQCSPLPHPPDFPLVCQHLVDSFGLTVCQSNSLSSLQKQNPTLNSKNNINTTTHTPVQTAPNQNKTANQMMSNCDQISKMVEHSVLISLTLLLMEFVY